MNEGRATWASAKRPNCLMIDNSLFSLLRCGDTSEKALSHKKQTTLVRCFSETCAAVPPFPPSGDTNFVRLVQYPCGTLPTPGLVLAVMGDSRPIS